MFSHLGNEPSSRSTTLSPNGRLIHSSIQKQNTRSSKNPIGSQTRDPPLDDMSVLGAIGSATAERESHQQEASSSSWSSDGRIELVNSEKIW